MGLFHIQTSSSGSHFHPNQHLCLNSEEETTFQSKGHLSSGELVCKNLQRNTAATVRSKTDQYNDKELVISQVNSACKESFYCAFYLTSELIYDAKLK